jgi:hypothetical protein
MRLHQLLGVTDQGSGLLFNRAVCFHDGCLYFRMGSFVDLGGRWCTERFAWRLRIMARVGDVIMEDGGLALVNGWSFWTKLKKEEEKDKKKSAKRKEKIVVKRGIRSRVEKSLAGTENFSVACEVELSSCCWSRQEELGRGRAIHEGMIIPSSFLIVDCWWQELLEL